MYYYARKAKDGKKQTLSKHKENVAKLSSIWAYGLNLSRLAKQAGLYHDLGKATQEFQDYLNSDEGKRGSVQHSIIGAKAIYEDYKDSLPVAEILANIIASHHGYLHDFLSPEGLTPLYSILKEHSDSLKNENSEKALSHELNNEFQAFRSKFPDKAFGFMMMTKLLYSYLIDADRLDAYNFENCDEDSYHPKQPDWETLLNRLNDSLNELKKKTQSTNGDIEILELRNDISNQCAKAGKRQKGIYKLEVPTGGGKTLSGLRFALEHAKAHNLERIIYVIPYLSILTQTAKDIRQALDAGDDIILEHHSNILPDNEEYYKLHTDRWDMPVILSTQVQFLESIFSAKGSDLRKLHHMVNSVIIFDEVQTLPIKCVHLFNSVLNFLNKACGSTILLCTATQPLLDKANYPVLLSDNSSIAICKSIPKRTEMINSLRPGGYTTESLADFIIEKHNKSTLVIVNTKKAAKALFNKLKLQNLNVLHLSTNMCPSHRDDVIDKLRNMLSDKTNVICVSTQLIEAGVDISFECVIRDLAGLDSIYQAAGRCNRHNEFREVKKVYVVNITNENLSRLKDIEIGADKTRMLFDDGNLNIDSYYEHYFHARRNEMDYNTKHGYTLYDLLTTNQYGRNAYKNSSGNVPAPTVLTCAIKSAADEFYVIAPGQVEVLTDYGNSKDLLDKYKKKPLTN